MTAKTSTDRVAKLRAKRLEKGHVRREYYATPEEHAALANFLNVIREKNR